jgi:hypothetical protein
MLESAVSNGRAVDLLVAREIGKTYGFGKRNRCDSG